MAEELEMGMTQAADMAADIPAADIAQNLNVDAALELDAANLQAQQDTPASFDINSIAPGGPGGPGGGFGEPSAPPKPGTNTNAPSDFMSAMTQVVDSNAHEIFVERYQPKTLEEKINPVVGPKTRYAGPDLDMFRYQEDFDPQGFNYFNPEKQKGYIESETWGSALSKGFDSFATRFGNTFTDSFASYGRMFDALVNWDWDKLKYTEEEMIEANFAEYKESMKNYVFVPPEEEDDIWSKRSVSEFVGNAGFALGTFAALGVELVGDAILTAVTGGGGAASFAGTAARVGAREAAMAGARATVKQGIKGAAFRFTDFVADMGRGAYHFANQSTDALSGTARVTNQANQARRVSNAGKVGSDALRQSMKEVFDIYTLNMRNIIKSKSFTELAGNIAKGTPILGTGIRYGEKIVAGAKGGLSTGKLIGIGLQGTRRMVQEFNMSSTEANFEAITGYGSTLDMMVERYRNDHDGENPPAAEFAKMKELAMKSASASYNTNLGILLLTNRLQFGSLFNKFAPANKYMKEILQEGVEGTLGVNRMWKSSKLLGKTYEKGFFGTYGLLGKISKDFGRKQALYEFGKQFSKDFLRFEVVEGLQENLQEMSGAAWKYYYAGQYNGTKYTLGQAFDKGLDEQFTKQGLRTFLQGALTGSLIRPVTASVSKFTNYLQEKGMERAYKDNPSENPYVKMREQLKRDINLTNDLMAQWSNKKLEDNVINFTNQVDAQLSQTEAAAKGLQYEWQNGQDNSVLAGALAANRSGSIAVYTQALREMGKTMSNEEFEAATGVKLEDTKYETVADFTAAMAKDVKKYSDTVDGIRRKVQNLPDPLMYEKGSKDRLVATIMHNAQEEAIRIIALNALKAGRAAERAQKVSQDLLKIPSFANSSEYALRVLTNPEMFKGETGNMQADIRMLEESLSVLEGDQKIEVQEKIKNKKRLLELYNTWLGYWDSRDQVLEREDDTTGERGESVEKIQEVFVGVPITVDEYDEDGNLIKKDSKVNKLDHEDIIKTFTEFINLKNKDLGITDEVSEEDIRNAFDKIVDFIRLEQDAKDYMRAMDQMYNPDYYRKVLTSIQDGRFKYEILEFVDSVNERVSDAVMFTVMRSDIDDEVEKLLLLAKLHEEVNGAIVNSEYYKNLVLITVDEKLGLDSAKFAQENVEKLNTLIQDKIAEILNKYAPQVMSNEVSDEDYEEFQKTNKVSGLLKTIIARKLASEETLTDRQSEVYKAFEEEINNIVDRLKATPEAVNDDSRLAKAKDAFVIAFRSLIQTGEFDLQTLDTMSQDDIFKLALERNLISEEEIAEEYTGKAVEVITDDVYNNFKNTGEVEDGVLESIARRDMENIELTNREKEIMQEYLEEITDIQNIIEDELARNEEEQQPMEVSEGSLNTGEAVWTGPNTVEWDLTNKQQEPEPIEKSDDPMAGANVDESQLNEALKLAGLEDAKDETDETKEPFEVTGENETGFNVNSRDGLTVNSEPLQTEEEALSLADELNTTRSDIDWATEFLGNLSEDEEAKLKLSKMVQSGKKSLAAYNKKNGTEIKTLEAYSKIPEGKRNLNDIKEAVIANVPLAQIKAKRKKLEKQEAEQLDLFDDTTSGFVGGPALPLQSVQDLFDRLESVTTAPVSDITKLRKGWVSFVAKTQKISEKEAAEKLKDIEWVTVYRAEGDTINLEETKLPDYVKKSKGRWFTNNEAVAKRYAKTSPNAKLYAVEVPKVFYDQVVEEGKKVGLGITAPGEILIPIDVANSKVELYALQQPTVTQEDIRKIEDELKDVERQLSALQSTEPTSEKTYQDLLNEKWPDASGYLTAPLTKFEFNKEEGKFVAGKHIFEIRPIGNNEFEYRVVNNKASQNRAIVNYTNLIEPASQQLNDIAGADAVVTVRPGILRKEGDKLVIVRQAQIFNTNSSTINNKVGSVPTQSTKAKTLDAKKTKLLEDLKEARLTLLNQASQQMSEKIGKFVKEEQVSEDTILDQLRKINSCFK